MKKKAYCPRCGADWIRQSGLLLCKNCKHLSGSQNLAGDKAVHSHEPDDAEPASRYGSGRRAPLKFGKD